MYPYIKMGKLLPMTEDNLRFMKTIIYDLEVAILVFALKIWRHHLYVVHVDVFVGHRVVNMFE